MARIGLTVVLVVLISVLVGCNSADQGKSQLVPAQIKTTLATEPIVQFPSIEQIDLIEKTLMHRQSYRQCLEMLANSYLLSGNDMKLQWAKREMAALDRIPQYNYIIEANIAGPDLKATASNPQADKLYKNGVSLENKAGMLLVVKDDDLLRVALDKYNQLIKMYPDSDKIDDATYRAAGIYYYFKDYSIAALYYQRTYQWDPQTPYPARYKAAYVLDTHLARRDEALPLYRQALKMEKLDENQLEYANSRISSLTKSDRKQD